MGTSFPENVRVNHSDDSRIKAMIVYFDTNVIRDLAEKRVLNAEEKAEALKNSITARKVIIAPSFEVLYELLSAPSIDNTIRIKNAQFYINVVDWAYALKPSDQMMRDDINNLARVGGPSTPYYPVDKDLNNCIQSVKKGENMFPPAHWRGIVNRSRQQNEMFVKLIFTKFVEKLPSDGKTKLKNSPKKTWDNWWFRGGLADLVADSLVEAVVGRQISDSALTLPTVRAAVGYILHTWYQQIITNTKVKPTDHYDFRNAVLAGGVEGIVTEDRKLKNAIKHIPECNIKACVLEEFIKAIP